MVIYKYGIQVTENVNSHALHLLRKRNNHDIISHGFWKKTYQVNHSSFNQKLLDIPFSKIQKDSEFRDNGFCLSVCLLAFLCFVFFEGVFACLLLFWGGAWSSSHTDSNCFDQNIDFGFFKGRFNSNHLHLNLLGIICLLRCGTDA